MRFTRRSRSLLGSNQALVRVLVAAVFLATVVASLPLSAAIGNASEPGPRCSNRRAT